MAKKKTVNKASGNSTATKQYAHTPFRRFNRRGVVAIFSITTPQAGTDTQVFSRDGTTGSICAQGVAVTEDGTPARSVWGKVYNTAAVSPPPTPTSDAIGTIPNQTDPNVGSWSMDPANNKLLPGASCSTAAPFPDNTLVLWFDWPDIGYQAYPIYFRGMASNQTECG
jgi:hypothetical protein